ncbi:DNA-deoxyinosine glycosylase [Caulobacter mirabilis]|uniref:DNA-deoxyinosine glycosylase n=1 Tax=Caulobacter mirabilis TaxID=69666 RepID=A0A2D2AVM8_9CAUL|nr:DNA-deoxyinosine glycosylase [Caulobacter mirabilis]ATQ42058.1 DNA-deoxyinosine glycosylase [Caulobacter mirabilis]
MTRKRSFPPVVDEGVRLLVLGSLPGEASLAAGRYYAHPRNAFWRLMGTVVGEDLHGMDYEARLATLLRHRVGLWDVVGEAVRPGSLDTAIRDATPNDLAALVDSLPALRAVGFNGGTSAKKGMTLLAGRADRLRLIPLPSSSPAFTLPFTAKAEAWAVLGDYV